MWWSRTRAAAALLAAALVLAACGFEPLYGRPTAATAEGPQAQMASVRIAPLPDRIGQQMHNFLRDRLNPFGQPTDPAYVLTLSLSESVEELGVRKDETATRANLRVFATYELRDAASGEVLLDGRHSSINSYNILDNQFATIFSERDARERGLRALSDAISTRLGVYFARTGGQAAL